MSVRAASTEKGGSANKPLLSEVVARGGNCTKSSDKTKFSHLNVRTLSLHILKKFQILHASGTRNSRKQLKVKVLSLKMS